MSGTIEPPKVFVETIIITRYEYGITELIPHTSAQYYIVCYNENTAVKTLQGILEGEQYKEWTTDDWLDQFMKSKVENL
jgi:hypothetical protein